MPDGLNDVPGTRTRVPDGSSRASGAALRRVLVVFLVLAAAGALAGVAWEALWQAPVGVVYDEQWFLDPAGPDASFSGTALYVLLAFPVGLALGAVAALVPRHEAVTLVAALVGSLVAGWLMYAVGHALGPADPRVLAAGAPDLTAVPSDLVLVGTSDAPGVAATPYRSTAFVAFPLGTLAGLTLVYLSGFGRARHG